MTYSPEQIVTQGFCLGCGLCQSIAGPNNIRLTMKAEGGERPAVVGTIDDATLGLINAVCPGIRAEGFRPQNLA
jgi:coenzyme F420 hydrogenase subunit beta